jgi:hypothetical protein
MEPDPAIPVSNPINNKPIRWQYVDNRVIRDPPVATLQRHRPTPNNPLTSPFPRQHVTNPKKDLTTTPTQNNKTNPNL